ncbi:MAG: tetratricopeptide repeat protein, partial [Halocynthiibacter sp.]
LEAGDVSSAAREFSTAYEAGEGDGAFYLGRLFELGLGADKDEMRAANLYAAGAKAGSTRSKARLGLIYHEGRVLLRDYAEGTKLLCEAADAGDSDGQLNCGLAYKAGRGVPVDAQKAQDYLMKAAAQENIAALNVLGRHYLDQGEQAKATETFKTAADKGNALGMYEYARLLAAPEVNDVVGAYAYANLAVVRGLRDAAAFRDGLETKMSPDDIAAGQEQAKAWTAAQIEKNKAKS